MIIQLPIRSDKNRFIWNYLWVCVSLEKRSHRFSLHHSIRSSPWCLNRKQIRSGKLPNRSITLFSCIWCCLTSSMKFQLNCNFHGSIQRKSINHRMRRCAYEIFSALFRFDTAHSKVPQENDEKMLAVTFIHCIPPWTFDTKNCIIIEPFVIIN